MNNTPDYRPHHYLLMTVDPVHVGTGGMRLGRVDLSIVREPGTRLPKIPGTSLSGAIRQYAAYRYGKRRCAGQGQAEGEHKGHCGRDTCPICYTFGFVQGENGGSARSGVVSIGDARLLLFPVHSMAGPVWVTSPSSLADFGIDDAGEVRDDRARWPAGLIEHGHLNLGWLLLQGTGDLSLGDLPDAIPTPARERVVLVSDKLFSRIVNSNLEVRTSVSIHPETGAADDGALYTYEAIPRAAVLWMDVTVDDYRGDFPKVGRMYNAERETDDAGTPLDAPWNQADDLVTAGLDWAEQLGIGGMNTRGFGRLRLLGEVPR